MAIERKNLKSEDAILPSLDLDDFDDEFDVDTPEKGGPIRKFTRGFFRGFLSRSNAREAMRSMIMTSLPDGYSRAIGGVEGLWAQSRYAGDEIVDKASAELDIIAARTESLLPHVKRHAPKGVYARIEKELNRARSGFSEREQFRPKTEDELARAGKYRDEEQLQAAVAELDMQAEANTQARYDQSRAEKKVYSKIQQAQIAGITGQLTSIAGGVERQVNYQDQITYRFQKKSLELQYRSYYALRDMHSLAKTTKELHEHGYTALVHNTALPEHHKRVKGDRSRYGKRASEPGFISRTISNSLSEHLGGYLPKLMDNVKQQIITGIRGTAAASDVAGDVGGGVDAGMAGQLAGEGLGGAVMQRFIIPQLAGMAKPFINRHSKRMGGFDKAINYGMNNAASIFQDYTQESLDDTGTVGGLKRILRGIAPRYFLDDEITEGSYQTIDREAAFNQLTQRSITDIIPGYLSRILHETRMLRTGDESSEREVYDITSGKFTGLKSAQAGVRGRVVNEVQRQNINNTLDSVVSRYDTEGELSEAAQETLRERLLRDAAEGGRFDARKYTAGEGYATDANSESVDELTQFFKARFELDDKGKLARNAQNFERLDDYSSAFLELRDVVPDPRAEIRRLHSAGNQEYLRDLGIVSTRHGVDRIDYNKLWSLYRSEGTEEAVNPDDLPPEATPTKENPFSAALKRKMGQVGESVKAKAAAWGIDSPDMTVVKDNLEGLTGRAKELDLPTVDVSGIKDVFKNRGFGASVPPSPTAHGYPGYGFTPDVRGQFPPVAESEPAAVPQHEAGFVDTLKDSSRTVFQPIGDVYGKYKNVPLLLARDLKAGNYTDVNSGQIISSLKDITGDVMDKAGWVVATGAELVDGLRDTEGRDVKSNVFRSVLDRKAGASQHSAGIGGVVKDTLRKDGEARDLYIHGSNTPVMLGRDIKAGKYTDVGTEDVIKTIDDITGDVRDTLTGDIVLTAEELSKGIYDTKGNPVNASRGRGLFNRYMSVMTTPSQLLGRGVARVAPKVAGAVAGLFKKKDRDVYLPGEETPRLTVAALKRGAYFDSKTQKPITHFDDIRNGVMDQDGNILLTEEDRPNSVTATGSKHQVAQGRVRKMIRGMGRSMVGGYINASKRYYKKLGKFAMKTALKPWAKKQEGEETGEVDPDEVKTPTDGILSRILGLLSRRVPKPDKEPRAGSWRAIMADRKAKREAAEADETTKGSKGAFGGLTGALGGILDKFKGRDEEDDEEDDGDTYGYADFSGDKKKPGRGRPRSKLGRLWQATKNLGKKGLGKAKLLGSAVAGSKWGGKALQAGRLLMSPLATVGRVAATAGAAVLGTLTAPVVLGAAAVAAVAGGGYMYYKRRQLASGLFKEYRLTQYGFSPNGISTPKKLLSMEDYLAPMVLHKPGESPTLDGGRLDVNEFFKLADIDTEDAEAVANFSEWLRNRFLPVFHAYNATLHALAPDVKLTDLDTKLTPDLGLEVLKGVSFKGSNQSPYSHIADPFDVGDTVSIDEADIESRRLSVEKHYKKLAEGKGKDGAAKNTPVNGPENPAEKGAAMVTAAAARRAAAKRGSRTPKTDPRLNAPGDKPTVPGMPAGSGVLLSLPAPVSRISSQSVTSQAAITPLQSIRMRQYGFLSVSDADASALLALEEEVFKSFNVQVGGGKINISFSGSSKAYFDWWMTNHPMNPIDETEMGLGGFSLWFTNRVVPVLTTYVGMVRQLDKTVPLAIGESKMSKDQKVVVAKRLLSVSGRPSYSQGRQSVFEVPYYLTKERPAPSDLKALAEKEYRFLKAVAEQETSSNNQKSIKERNVDNLVAKTTNALKNGTEAPSLLQDELSNVPVRPSPLSPRSVYKPGGAVIQQGTQFGGLTKGNGGMWESIPMPKSNRSMQAAVPTLTVVSKMTGVEVGILVTFASIESAFDYLVSAKTSSATGWFQFIDATWDQMIKEHGDTYQIPSDPQRALRKDPRVNALMGAEFLKGNYKTLEKATGRAPSDTDLYLAHFMGASGAVKFLKQDTNAPAARIFPKPAKANRSIFYKPGGESRTIGEVYALMDEKVSKHRYGGGQSQDTARQLRPGEPVIQVGPSDSPGAFRPVSEAVVPTPKAGANLSNRVSATVNPMNGYVPSTGGRSGGLPPPQSSTNAVVASDASNGSPEDPVIQRQIATRRNAIASDRREQLHNDQNLVNSRAMGQLMEKQLVVQETMRDYLKEIAQSVGGVKTTGGKESVTPTETSNDTSKPTSIRPTGQRRESSFPVNLREH